MGFTQAIRSCLSQYVTFSGRARRSEFWYFALFQILAGLALSIIDSALFGRGGGDPQIFGAIFSLAMLLPALSVSVRRLHDLDRVGWWWWLWLLPIIGWIILIIWYVSRGTVGDNQYGPDPFDADDDSYGDVTHTSSIPQIDRDR